MILSWYTDCVLVGRALRNAPDPQPDPPIAANESPTDAKFEITDCKLYIPVVTLSAENDSKLLEQLKSGFRITIKWNKYISQVSNQNKNNNLSYLIDPTLVMLIDYLYYLLKMKMTELLTIILHAKYRNKRFQRSYRW